MTLNATGESSAPEQSGSLISTAEFEPAAPASSEETRKTDGEPAGDEEGKAKEVEPSGEPEEEGGGEPDPWKVLGKKVPPIHTHPRVQEMTKERAELREQLAAMKARMELLEQARETKPEPKPQDLPQIFNKTDEQLREMFDENPKAVLAEVLKAAQHTTLSKVEQDRQAEAMRRQQEDLETRAKSTFDKFAENHSDFYEKWENGEIPKYMKENPGIHNAISAYYLITQDERAKSEKERIDAAVKKAVADAEKKFLENQKAKRSAAVLGSGPAGAPAGEEHAELKDTKKHGGLTAVLTERLLQRRRQV